MTITSGTFTDEDWSWEFGLPVMSVLCSIRRLADNSGIEPAWLFAAVEDVYDEGAGRR
ncbi:MAG: hypothetical protein ACTH2Y_13775 [Corynebacterium sp.]|uniref:hypothetical protein n=1 Tax=unclassified Corynebacterium TaxID=2624378 RepID=UPI0026480D1F|nr:hypothetical protein [Corynebacterium sp.]MDN5581068.1 hypothetical protein [Corynebacterium sp.]MDN5718975.1 hypothetical protein [Corynebacterium sp.]MDN6259823.1 hypothetical protein [Corynebacterium sp.]MDN6324821.1 hypothetical protein [Corynebacterium sp.]